MCASIKGLCSATHLDGKEDVIRGKDPANYERCKARMDDGTYVLIDAGVGTSTSIIKHLKVRVCVPGGIGRQGRGMISMKHSAITLKSPGAVRIYLPNC